jgi:hypothetical protein
MAEPMLCKFNVTVHCLELAVSWNVTGSDGKSGRKI